MASFSPIKLPRNPDECAPWLYEALSRLSRAASSSSQGMSAILRGEAPDGSGSGLVDTSKFFYKPGLVGGQVAYGGTNAADTLVLSSTAGAPKGFIYLGEAKTSAYDEANDYLGVGIATPTARVHLKNAVLGTSTIGTSGTAFLTCTYAAINKLTIAPLLNASGVVDIALNVNSGSVQFIDSSIGTAGLRVAFSAARAFIQTGRIDSSSVIQNKNLTLGGMNATLGTDLRSNFQIVAFQGDTGSGPANTGTTVGINQDPTVWNTGLGGVTSLVCSALRTGSPARNMAALFLHQESPPTATNEFFMLGQSAGGGTSPTGAPCFSVTAQGRIGIYNGGNGVLSSEIDGLLYALTVRDSFVDASNHLILTASTQNRFSDGAAKAVATLQIGDTWASTGRWAVIESGNKSSTTVGVPFDRLGISALLTGLCDAASTAGGSFTPPTALLHLKGTVSDSTVICKIETSRSGQTGDLLQLISAVSSTVNTAWNCRNVMVTGRIKTAVLFTDDNATIANAKLLGLSVAGITAGQTRTWTAQDVDGTVSLFVAVNRRTGITGVEGSATTVYTVPKAGVYRITVATTCTTAGTTSSNVQITLGWNDGSARSHALFKDGQHNIDEAYEVEHETVILYLAASSTITVQGAAPSGGGSPVWDVITTVEAVSV